MKTSRALTVAALLSATSAVPAMAAQWDNIGSVDIDYNLDRSHASPDFGGSVESLRFTARGGDVQCRYIRATFANGNTRDLLSGRLAQGDSKSVDLPGSGRDVKRIEFMCHTFSKAGAKVQIEANIGQYRNDWQNGPQWAYWSRFFTNWTRAIDNATSYWVPLGNLTYTGPSDRDNTFGSFAGRSITALAFRPVNGSALCTSANIKFANGTNARVAVNGGRPLMAGQTYKIDLPGGQRNVTNVVMRCHALGQRSVTISVLGNK